MTETVAALTPDEARALLREFVVVVRPGETLILRVGSDFTPWQVRELQDALNWVSPEGEPAWPFRTLVIPGEELGVAQPETDAAFANRVARALQQNAMRNRFPMRPAGG